MAAACKSGLGEVGLDIWMAWSETSDRFNRRDALSVWRSFKPEGGITIGSLFSLARENGWYEETVDLPRRPLVSDEDLERRRREREHKANQAAAAAVIASNYVATSTLEQHPYFDAKGFPERKGLVLRGELLVPMRHYRNRGT